MDLVMHPGVYPDYDTLGSRLRAIDKFECKLTHQLEPGPALRAAIALSSKWWIGTINGEEHMAVGVAPVEALHGWGSPWCLTSPDVFKGQPLRTFLRRSPEFLRECSEGYDFLFNYISAHNHESIRWLRWMGFNIKETPVFVRGFALQEFSLDVRPSNCSNGYRINGSHAAPTGTDSEERKTRIRSRDPNTGTTE